MNKLMAFIKDDSGAAAAEYVLILAVVGAGVGAGAFYLGSKISSALTSRADAVSSCSAGAGC